MGFHLHHIPDVTSVSTFVIECALTAPLSAPKGEKNIQPYLKGKASKSLKADSLNQPKEKRRKLQH